VRCGAELGEVRARRRGPVGARLRMTLAELWIELLFAADEPTPHWFETL
jgi:hypothetical protein